MYRWEKKDNKIRVAIISEVVSEIIPGFKYPTAFATNLFEMSNDQIYFAKHLTRLTDIGLKKMNSMKLRRCWIPLPISYWRENYKGINRISYKSFSKVK